MTFGVAVLLFIIVIDIIAMIFVMFVGSRHDAHHEYTNVDHYKSISNLKDRGYKIGPPPAADPKPEEVDTAETVDESTTA